MATNLPADSDQHTLLLEEWLEARREAAKWEAKAAAALGRRAALFDADVESEPLHRDAIWRSMVAELSAAAHMARGSIEHALTDARSLASDFPALRASFGSGDISAAHVREVVRAASPVIAAIHDGTVEADVLGVYEAASVQFAEHESPARTRAHVREIAAVLAEQTVSERQHSAAGERAVTVRSVGDGLALLQAVVPEHYATAILDRLTQMALHQRRHVEDRDPAVGPMAECLQPDDFSANSLFSNGSVIFGVQDTYTVDPFHPGEPSRTYHWIPESEFPEDPAQYAACCDAIDREIAAGPSVVRIPGDPRTLDQIRSDLLIDLMLGADPSEVQGAGLQNITGQIHVTIAGSTLADLDDKAAMLDGHGPLLPDVARTLAGRDGGWTRLFLDPSGLVTQTDTYTPTTGMKRFLRARDQHCRFPGCRMPVHRCDIDHTHDYALGGPTALNNLAHLCRSHHVLKHPSVPEAHRWKVRQLPNWELEWISPNGRVHTDSPPRRVMFVPTDTLGNGSAGTDSAGTDSVDISPAEVRPTTEVPLAACPF
ncbi:No significant database matches [Microbacterium esteraromaticum]|uniref:No significant database matches n=1 Tax=Microbacterium esteraromaticum TaxID=57043 RepID=A0A1R4KAJ3_9MICO|nr:HNH endonuclease signature motif containing protein [Microbacterium esteraromaticum]SJN41340.1 No significant database matches [Microbacterium esteraromaticum]